MSTHDRCELEWLGGGGSQWADETGTCPHAQGRGRWSGGVVCSRAGLTFEDILIDVGLGPSCHREGGRWGRGGAGSHLEGWVAGVCVCVCVPGLGLFWLFLQAGPAEVGSRSPPA